MTIRIDTRTASVRAADGRAIPVKVYSNLPHLYSDRPLLKSKNNIQVFNTNSHHRHHCVMPVRFLSVEVSISYVAPHSISNL